MASICCSPPESRLASWLRRSCSRGNMSNTKSTVQKALPPLGLRAATAQVLAHREALEDAATLRDEGHALPGVCSGAKRETSSNTSTVPARGGNRPTATLMQVDLPAPLRPMRPSKRPSPTANDTFCRTWPSP